MKDSSKNNFTLNNQQLKAVKHGQGPILIIAGAGTGKTTVITERIKYLIAKGLAKPLEILALTFTEKASHEMEERVDKALPYGLPDMWISTFHSFCDRILRSEAINIGLDPGYKLMTEAETIIFFRKNLFLFDLDYFRPLGNPTKFISGILGHFNRLRDEDITPKQYDKWVSSKLKVQNSKFSIEEINKYQELAGAFRKYEELKVKEGVFDYADLISQTLKLFRTRPKILSYYQKQFKYILVDEFQDTNFAQNELAIMLAGNSQNITVVGDDDQAIYRFRGAAISNIIDFRRRFPKAKIIVLTQNYRSTKTILDSSYKLIQNNNPDRLEIAENIDKKLESMRRIKGETLELCYTDRVENEAEFVAKKIHELVEVNHQSKANNSHTENSYSSFAVLVRANNHSGPFVRAFERLGIPYQFLGPGQLFRQPEVKDLISYLKTLYNFGDNVAMYRVLSMDFSGLDGRDIAALINSGRKLGITLFEVCEQITESSIKTDNNIFPLFPLDKIRKISRLVAMIHRHMGLIKKESAGQILYFFLEETGILKKLTSYKSVNQEKEAVNIAKFFDKLKTFEINHEDSSVFAVVDWIDLAMDLGESPLASDTDWIRNDAVNIMTVHSAKGLEFDTVFLVNLVTRRFPTTERKEQIPIPDQLVKELIPVGDYHLEEERRLFYVGMTRARDRLFFTGSKYYGEGKREKKLSPFVVETLGENIVSESEKIRETGINQLNLLSWAKVPEKSQKEIKHPIGYLSFSQISTYNTCPLQYKYRYVLKIPVPPSAALSFGDTMHRSLEEFYRRVIKNQKPALEELLTIYDQKWNAIGFGNRIYEDKMKNRGRLILSEFYKKGYQPGFKPKFLEQVFKIKISPSLSIGGKIDRIDEFNDGTIEIIDYKTGQAPKTKNVSNDLQLSVYALAATSPGLFTKDPDDVTVSFYFLENQEKVSSKRNHEQLSEIKNSIITNAQNIEASDFKPSPGKHCDFCEFRLICEAWQ